jgi:hypothetical protein
MSAPEWAVLSAVHGHTATVCGALAGRRSTKARSSSAAILVEPSILTALSSPRAMRANIFARDTPRVAAPSSTLRSSRSIADLLSPGYVHCRPMRTLVVPCS